MVAISSKYLLGILLPTFNDYSLFCKALDSVLPFLEKSPELVYILVSDDSHKNDVACLVKRKCMSHSISYVQGPKTSGPANWNTFQRISADFVWILHHDESYSGNHSELLHTLQKQRFESSHHAYILSSCSASHRYLPTLSAFMINMHPESILYSNYIGSPSCVIFRHPGNLSFSSSYPYIVDTIFYWSLSILHGYKFNALANHSCFSDNNMSSITNSLSNDLLYHHNTELKNFLYANKISRSRSARFYGKLLILIFRCGHLFANANILRC